MSKKLVSIIMPTYNCAKFIGETIESVQKQTYKDWELIIVDDCSKDNTKDVVNKYLDDKRIKYHLLKENSGAAVARTKAMELAKGNYMAFLDSDDLWTKDKLSKQIEFMEKNNYNFTCTAYEQIDEDSNNLNKIETLCDIGTGAGFPGMVIKILFPNIKITLLDSLNKRINFLDNVIKTYNFLIIYYETFNYNENYTNILYAKNNLLTAYSIVEKGNWTLVHESIVKSSEYLSNIVNNINNNQYSQYNINQAFIAVKELENIINVKDLDIFYIKYIIAIKKLDNL